MNAALENLATVRRQLEAVGAAAAKDLESIERKEAKKHRDEIDEYRLAKENLRKAREEHDELEESAHVLGEELDAVTEELSVVQQRVDDKVRGTTDSACLVDIRAAIQRLREENRKLDVKIGVLDHELTVSRMRGTATSSRAVECSEDDDESSFGDDDGDSVDSSVVQ